MRSAVNCNIAIRIRKRSWAFAAVLLVVFCWFGWAAVGLRALFEGLELHLHVAKRLTVAYGPIAFPIFGVVAAAAWVLSDVYFRGRWIQWFLFAFFSFVVFGILATLVSPMWGPIESVH